MVVGDGLAPLVAVVAGVDLDAGREGDVAVDVDAADAVERRAVVDENVVADEDVFGIFEAAARYDLHPGAARTKGDAVRLPALRRLPGPPQESDYRLHQPHRVSPSPRIRHRHEDLVYARRRPMSTTPSPEAPLELTSRF